MKLIPKNWSTFQHYKDRSPPWIKLHREILTNYDFACLPVASKAIAPLLWLLASEEKNGEIDMSMEELSFRLHIDQKTIADGLMPLINKGFFTEASGVLADCWPDARPETETETEEERETEGETKLPTKIQQKTPDGVSNEVFKDFVKLRKGLKAPVTETAIKGLEREGIKAGMTLQQVMEICCQNGWRGFKADWMKEKEAKNAGDRNREVMSGLTRGLIGGNKNVGLLGK